MLLTALVEVVLVSAPGANSAAATWVEQVQAKRAMRETPRQVDVQNLLGDIEPMTSPGEGIRILYTDAPDAAGMVDLDFNPAYNPPCAFNPDTTCPLPPRRNRLPARITAGEQKYPGPARTRAN